MNDKAYIAQYAVAKAVEFMVQNNIPLADEQKFSMVVGFMFGLMYVQAMNNTTPPQDDLTAERARQIAAKANKCCYRMDGYAEEIELFALQQLQTACQEALREVAEVAREFLWEQPTVHADPLRQARFRGNREAGQVLAGELDRLASEGG